MQHHNQPRTWHPQPHHPTTEEPSSFSFSRPIERAQRCLGMQRRCARHCTRGVHETIGQKLKHDTSQRLSPTKLRCTIGPNTTQTKAGNSRNDCAEFTHDTHKVALHHRPKPKHNTNKKAGNGRNDCVCGSIYPVFTHATHPQSLHHRPKPNTTQTKAGNGRNDLPTHPQVACTIAASPQTQHKQQKPATAATILRNLPTHPQSRSVGPNTNIRQRPQRLCGIFARWSTKSQREKTS